MRNEILQSPSPKDQAREFRPCVNLHPQQSLSLETNLVCNAVPCFPCDNIVGNRLCDECKKSALPSVCHIPESICANFFNIILILWFERNPAVLDPFGLISCGGGYSVEVPSCREFLQWIIGYVDNRSGFGEEDDNNTGEVEERDGEEVLSVACSKGRTMTRG